MENASKALIIAGAILLSILLISLGIMIFNQASSQVNNSGMSDAELSSFNQKWTKYEGATQKGTMVRSLVQEVISNNNGDESGSSRQVQIVEGAADTSVKLDTGKGKNPTYAASFANTGTYSVKCDYDSSGRINKITVTKK